MFVHMHAGTLCCCPPALPPPATLNQSRLSAAGCIMVLQGLSDMDSEERDDYVLRSSDLLLLAARNEDDVSTIEVWVYEEASSSTGKWC